ncbi:protein kinase domain-containing protein [Actinomadura meridiana]|uniref:protein kinase domain-containing protein n=1 Tax=Actinomadura meridiana TaxID=559626 RepID=UPI0031ECC1F0
MTARIGEGAQGSVFLGESGTGRRVAVKLLHADVGNDERARTLFDRELAAARRVAPFCTARILAAEADDDVPYIVSEYIDGPSLRERISGQGVPSGDELVRLAIGTATALAAIHEAGVVHRDFKPANVLLGADGPKVIDFGIARPLDATAATMTGAVGTPAYMAPEQVAGAVGGPPLDMFAWGCTVAFAANGVPPFGNDSVPAIMQRVLHAEPDLGALTGDLRDLVAACLAKDAAARPTALQVLQRLLGTGPGATLTATDGTYLLAEGTSAAAAPPATVPSPQGPPTPPPNLPPPGSGPGFGGQPPGSLWPSGPPLAPAPPGAPFIPPGYPQQTFPQQTGPSAPGRRNGRPLAIVGAAAAVLLVAGGVGAAILLRDDKDPSGGASGARSTAPNNAAATDGATGASTKTCAYADATTPSVKDVGKPPSQITGTLPTRATIKTNLGTLQVELDAAKAPCTVNSLAFLAGKKYYDQTSCHRLSTAASLKVLQCGDPSGTGTGGPSYRVPDENLAGARYTRGVVAMANSGPNTNGSQFFIVYADSTIPADYTPFGRVTSGMEFVDGVAAAGADPAGDGKPKKAVTITELRTA